METTLLTSIQSLLSQADDPDLTPNQLAAHRRNIFFEIQELIEQYRKKLASGVV